MQNILSDITNQTRQDLLKRKREVSFAELENFRGYEKNRISFKKALSGNKKVSVIAEVKKASPSKGIIRDDFNHITIAEAYKNAGASAISVLTDVPFFKGDLRFLDEISAIISLPTLRKDFITDPYQIKEARAFGADAVLLISTITEGRQLDELLHAASEYELDALVECYSHDDFEKVNFDLTDVLGVNNRDLNTFKVDVHRGIELLKQAPKNCILVSESGLAKPEDLSLLHEHGIHAALIGEHLMRQKNPETALKNLLDYKFEQQKNKHL